MSSFNDLISGLSEDTKRWLRTIGPNGVSKILQDAYNNETKSSVAIGMRGEEEVERIMTSKYTILRTSKTHHSGDFIIKTVNGVRVLIEVKKWTSTITESEKTKFLNDIESNGSVDAAVMISSTKISNIKQSIQYIEHNNGTSIVPIVYATCDSKCVSQIIDILEIDVLNRRRFISVDIDINTVIQDLSQQIDYITDAERVLVAMNKDFNKHYVQLTQKLITARIKLKQNIQCLQSAVTEDVNDHTDIKISDIKILSKTQRIQLQHVLTDLQYKFESITDKLVVISIGKITIKANKSSIKFHIPITLSLEIVQNFTEFNYSGGVLVVSLSEANSNYLSSIISATPV